MWENVLEVKQRLNFISERCTTAAGTRRRGRPRRSPTLLCVRIYRINISSKGIRTYEYSPRRNLREQQRGVVSGVFHHVECLDRTIISEEREAL